MNGEPTINHYQQLFVSGAETVSWGELSKGMQTA